MLVPIFGPEAAATRTVADDLAAWGNRSGDDVWIVHGLDPDTWITDKWRDFSPDSEITTGHMLRCYDGNTPKNWEESPDLVLIDEDPLCASGIKAYFDAHIRKGTNKPWAAVQLSVDAAASAMRRYKVDKPTRAIYVAPRRDLRRGVRGLVDRLLDGGPSRKVLRGANEAVKTALLQVGNMAIYTVGTHPDAYELGAIYSWATGADD